MGRIGNRRRKIRWTPDIPETSINRIVFLFKRVPEEVFSKKDFNPVATQGIITEADIDKFFEELKNSPHYLYPDVRCEVCALYLITTIVLCLIIGVTMANLIDISPPTSSNQSKDNGPSVTDFIPLMFLPVLIGGIITINCCLGRKVYNLLQAREADFKRIAAEQNKIYFQAKGVRWVVGKNGDYLILELDFIT